MTDITYIDGNTGSGKTAHIINEISKSTENFLIVAPTRELCNEIADRFTDRSIDALVVHQLVTSTPQQKLYNALDNMKNRVVITTQASFYMIFTSGIPNKGTWNIVFDEDFNIIKDHSVSYSQHTRRLIKAFFRFSKDRKRNLYSVTEKNEQLFEIHQSEETFLDSRQFKDLATHIVSPNYDTYMLPSHYDKLNKKLASNSATRRANMFSVMNIKSLGMFKSITVVAACFEETVTYKLLKELGANLTKKTITSGNSKPKYKVNVYHYVNKNWSSTLRKKQVGRTTVEEKVYAKVKDHIAGKKFIFNTNVSFRDKVTDGVLVTAMFGVNSYMDFSTMVYLPSLNATVEQVNVLGHFGISRKDVDESRNMITAYQFVSRGAVRDMNFEGEINIHVPDKRTADFLKKKLENVTIIYDRAIVNRKPVPAKIKTLVSRTKRLLQEGKNMRQSTIDRYHEALEEYYGTPKIIES